MKKTRPQSPYLQKVYEKTVFEKILRQLAFLDETADAPKILMIDFYTTWCMPCKQLDFQTFKNPKVKAWMQKNKVSSNKVDAEAVGFSKELAQEFEVKSYPTLLFIDKEKRVLGRIQGFRDTAEFIAEAMEIKRNAGQLRAYKKECPKRLKKLCRNMKRALTKVIMPLL